MLMRPWPEVVIIGGGVIGLSVAYHLLRLGASRVVVLEKEPVVGCGATGSCTGGIRHQFSTRVNVELTRASLPHFARFEEEMGYPIGFRQDGYLLLTASEARLEELRRSVELQRELGVPAELLSPVELARRFPYLDVAGLVGGTFCPLDGYADPYGVVQGYCRRVARLGGRILSGEEVVGIRVEGGKVKGVVAARSGEVPAEVAVNAAGAHAAEVARLAGAEVPVRPYRRQVFVSQPVPGLDEGLPLTVDLDTGWYLHREKNGLLLLGGTDRDTRLGFSVAVDREGLEAVAEAGLRRVPLLEKARISRAYAGLRALTPDYHAVLGPDPGVAGLYHACGFCGHGFMHAPAAGQALAQLIARDEAGKAGITPVVDIAPLSPARFQGPARQEALVW